MHGKLSTLDSEGILGLLQSLSFAGTRVSYRFATLEGIKLIQLRVTQRQTTR